MAKEAGRAASNAMNHLFEISTDKVDAEIPSPSSGTLEEIKVAEGTTVGINTIVCTLSENGAGAAVASKSPAVAEPETAAAPSVDSAEPAAADAPAATQGNPPAAPGTESGSAAPAPAAASSAATEVLMPQMGESITEGTITKWLKKVGDSVQRDEPHL